jgi:nucleoside-triphosphatase THEP1
MLTEPKEQKEIIDGLLKLDLMAFAGDLGLIQHGIDPLPETFAVRCLGLAEELSRNHSDPESKSKCLLICGLLWEHRNTAWYGLVPILVELLTRLGLPPSARMIDGLQANSEKGFSALGSLVAELDVGARLTQHEVAIDDLQQLLLSSFQKELWELIGKERRIGISAPTSSGKSYILVAKLVDILRNQPGEALYIVPTISLITQVTNDIRRAAREFKVVDLVINQTYSEAHGSSEKNRVYVLTQERALSAITQFEKPFGNLRIAIVDEIQNIERVANEDEERAHIMYDVVQEIQNTLCPPKIVIAGPRLKNIKELSSHLFGEGVATIIEDLPPVVNLTYAFSKNNGTAALKQYSTVNEYPQTISVSSKEGIDLRYMRKSTYDESYHSTLSHIIKRVTNGSGTIVFAPNPRQSRVTALELAKKIKGASNDENLHSLSAYLRETIHEKYSLAVCARKGVAYHNAQLPQHARTVVEVAFSNLSLKTVVCTTTLLQGVNFPAKNIIARNPNLFVRKRVGSVQLTGYEFANLRGRAGRLMKDFVGRAIILDEASFEESSIELFDYPENEVSLGYGERFKENKDAIIENLMEGEQPKAGRGYGDLLVYVRSMIMKHGEEAVARLRRTGVDISRDNYLVISEQLSRMTVPREICVRNPHWDPFVLELLYQRFNRDNWDLLPKSPFDFNFVNVINETVLAMKQLVPYYYDKYFGEPIERRVMHTIVTACNWSQEKPLREVIGWGDIENADTIDERLQNLNTRVVYALPKLLRPVVQIQDPTNPVLVNIEMGAYRPETRRLIELGLARETSLRVLESIKRSGYPILLNENVNDRILLEALRNLRPELSYWDRVQVEPLLQ